MHCPQCLTPVPNATAQCPACQAAVLAPPVHGEDPDRVLSCAHELTQRGQSADALALCQRLLADGIITAAVHRELGEALLASGAHRPAITAFQAALALDPHLPDLRARIDDAFDAMQRKAAGRPITEMVPSPGDDVVQLCAPPPRAPAALHTSPPRRVPWIVLLLLGLCLLLLLLWGVSQLPGVRS
jgi:hypothetical protein